MIQRTYHVCEGGIEKTVPRNSVWHHKACRVMTNGGHKGQIFISHPHKNNGFFYHLLAHHQILQFNS